MLSETTAWLKEQKTIAKHPVSWHNWTDSEVDLIREKLLDWYEKNERPMPWRVPCSKESTDPERGYRVWISEVMLQQTQVATVIPYYVKWMEKWPTLASLAEASLDDVLKLWAGLGYYSRAERAL